MRRARDQAKVGDFTNKIKGHSKCPGILNRADWSSVYLISFIGVLLDLYHSLDVKLLRKRKRNLRVELTSMKRMKKVESEQNLQWKLILRQFVLMQSELVVTFLRMYRLTCLRTCRLRICCPRTCCLKRSCYVSKCSYSHSQWLSSLLVIY